jgi:hypothetical protein
MMSVTVCCSGCTIKVEPLPKTPVKQYARHRRVHHNAAHPDVTPTPAPKREQHEISRPLQLEPTDHPTPVIKLPDTVMIKRIHPMTMYL